MNKDRPSKDDYYLNLAREVTGRAVCFRRVSGAIILVEDSMVSTGYTGAPRSVLDCSERGFCLRDKLGIPSGQQYELCRSVHAEQNAIINAARVGGKVLGGTMYIFALDRKTEQPVDAFPCFICKKIIINAGLNRVVCSTADGKTESYLVRDWVYEWRKKGTDIIDDKKQYGIRRNNDPSS